MKKHISLFLIILFIFSCKEKKENSLKNVTESISERKIKQIQLKDKSISDLRILRNEIFAKKGYIFKDSILNKYFSKKEWYKPNKDATILLSDIEKENIALIKKIELSLKPFKIPDDYKILETISIDFDKDEILDIVQLVKGTEKTDFNQSIYFYLSKNQTLQKIDLPVEDEFDETQAFIRMKDNTTLQFDYTIPGTGLFNFDFKLKYNSEIENFQLITYEESYRLGYLGYGGKKYNLITGDYEVYKEAVDIDDTSKRDDKNEFGNQKTKIITPNLINGGFHSYLGNTGNEFNENFTMTDPNGYEITNCNALITKRLILELKYGDLSYFGGYIIFKKEITDFITSINMDELINKNRDILKHTSFTEIGT